MQFLGYVVTLQGVSMEHKKIKAICNWLESRSIQDIQIFPGFAKFYKRFISDFGRIAALIISKYKPQMALQLTNQYLHIEYIRLLIAK